MIFKQQPQKSHKQDILPKNPQIYQSFFASGTQDVEVTKSLYEP